MRFLAAIGLLATLGSISSQAATVTYQVSGEAKAVITTGNGTITISLTDLFVNPNSVIDNVSAFSFTLSSVPTSVSINTSSSASIDVANDGTYTSTGTIAPGWALSRVSAVTTLDDLGTGGAGPSNTLIGSPDSTNNYSAGHGSIDGNTAHNPFLSGTATWTLNAVGVTTATTVTATMFQFGTTDGQNQVAGALVATPEPASSAMLAGGISLLLLGYRRVRKSRS